MEKGVGTTEHCLQPKKKKALQLKLLKSAYKELSSFTWQAPCVL
jgi:hypothetical protein